MSNQKKVDDKYYRRLWPPKCKDTHWEIITKSEIIEKQRPYIFLVKDPLTFGHSQLVVPNTEEPNTKNEEDVFYEAAEHVRCAIKAFRKAFKKEAKPIHTLPEFKHLAKCTHTKGAYIKTLILKTSADEELRKEYKVHLVPYFESHADDCEKLHQFLHHKISGTGSLLGWLGKREYEVDSWKLNDDIVKNHLKIHKLAEKLREYI